VPCTAAHRQEVIFTLFEESEREPNHLLVKNRLHDHFGEDVVSQHRTDIRDVMAQLSETIDINGRRTLRRESSAELDGRPRVHSCVAGCQAKCGYMCIWLRYVVAPTFSSGFVHATVRYTSPTALCIFSLYCVGVF
jgi:hypothetical protein